MFDAIWTTYADWKGFTGTAYYTESTGEYTLIKVDNTNQHVFLNRLLRGAASTPASVTDFETTVLPGATLVNDVADAIVAES